ncbi:hypothetical protein [Mesorhizobium sp. DCY119]|uniref:hypothetical protein n=1 Tax=Mesorhizobium sp. DCY119 TaxID=2108445 RepID=UPI000E6BEA63|nr:hypothetical protein [Mesorhizobium sp. DCY119]RJG46539.1 hypothetical protein D3Y55_21330 [Mesorhizobium sp. DCY119]
MNHFVSGLTSILSSFPLDYAPDDDNEAPAAAKTMAVVLTLIGAGVFLAGCYAVGAFLQAVL